MLAADEAPPADARTWPCPTWQVGDSFTLVRGDVLRGTYTVVAADDQGYTLETGGRTRLRRDRALGNLGAIAVDGDAPVRVMSPVDARYHWPLWVGKRWQCEFVDRAPGKPPLTMLASYVVEALDEIRVPAGTFRALRVRRTLRLLADEGKFMTRTQMTWYDPEAGVEVRQLIGDTMVELVETNRR